jgi:nucleoid-associated protein YgaU
MAKHGKGSVGPSNSNKSNQSSASGKAVAAEKSVSATKSVSSDKAVKQESGADSRSIVIAGVVILLLLAGIGFLILGLAQSLNSGRVGDTGEIAQNRNQVANDDLAAAEANIEGNEDAGSTDNNANAGTDTNSGSNDTANGGDVASDGPETSNSQGDSAPVVKDGMVATSKGNFKVTENTYRRGNTYKVGDIKGDNYTVKKGDTLWQIAQGRYGSGYAWTAINNANGGFPLLKNGTPNNVPVGYNLILPRI